MANLDNGGNYQKEYQAFIAKLFKFHAENGNPIKRIPMLGGRELDLYHLYSKVKALGGVETVTRCRLWGEVARSYNLPATVTSASYAVRMHYAKYLEKFVEAMETGNFTSGHAPLMPRPPPRPLVPSLSRTSSSGHASNPASSHHALQARIPQLRAVLQATHLQQPKEPRGGLCCDRLVRSLQCGLPNEVDFTLNVLTMLSYGGGVTEGVVLNLEKYPQLLDAMLAHVAVFPEDDPGLEPMYQQNWHRNSESDFIRFWELTVPDWVCASVTSSRTAGARPHNYEKDLFGGGGAGPSEGAEGYRVGQVLTVLRNCSFLEGSVEYLAGHEGVLRFLLLCVNSSLPYIRGPGLDTVANIASSLLLAHCEPYSTVELLLASAHNCILSQDKYDIIRGLEVLGELAWCLANEASLSETPPAVYRQMFQVLLLPDCELVISSLDALYNLSFYGSDIAEDILDVANALEILTCLLTLRVESFGMDELAKIDLFLLNGETPLSLSDLPATQSPNSTVATSSAGGPGAPKHSVVTNVSIPATPAVTPNLPAGGRSLPAVSTLTAQKKNASSVPFLLPAASIPVLHLPPNFPPQLVKQMTAATGISAPFSSPGSVPSKQSPGVHPLLTRTSVPNLVWSQSSGRSSTAVSTQLSASSLLPAAGLPAEEYAQKWLRACYEEAPGQYMPQIDMHTLYIVQCSQAGQNALLDSIEFNSVIKKVLPNSLATRLTVGSHSVYMIAGIRKRNRLLGVPVLKENTTLLQKSNLPINNSGINTNIDLVETSTVIPTSKPIAPLLQNFTSTLKAAAAVTGISPPPPILANKGSFAVHSPLMVANKAVDSGIIRAVTPNMVHAVVSTTTSCIGSVTTSCSTVGNRTGTVGHTASTAPSVTPLSSSTVTQSDSRAKSTPVAIPATNSFRDSSQDSVALSNCKPTSNDTTAGETHQETQRSLVSEASTDGVSGLKIQSIYSLAGLDQITKEHSYSQDPGALRSRESIAASALLSFSTMEGEDDGSVSSGSSPAKATEATDSYFLSVGPPPGTFLESPAKTLVTDTQEESGTENQLEQNAVSEMIVDIEGMSELDDQGCSGVASSGVEEAAPSIETETASASALNSGELGLVAERASELRPDISTEKQKRLHTGSGVSPGDLSPKARQQESENRENIGAQNHRSSVAELTDSMPDTNTSSDDFLSDDDLSGSESKRAKLEVESGVGTDHCMEMGQRDEDSPLNESETKSTGTPVTCISDNTCAITASSKSPSPVTTGQQSTCTNTASSKSPSPVTTGQRSTCTNTASSKSPSPVTTGQRSTCTNTASSKSPSPVTTGQRSTCTNTASSKSPSPVTTGQRSTCTNTASSKSPSPVTSKQQSEPLPCSTIASPKSPVASEKLSASACSQIPSQSTFDSSSTRLRQQKSVGTQLFATEKYSDFEVDNADDVSVPEPKRIKVDVENADNSMEQGRDDMSVSSIRTTGDTHHRSGATPAAVTCVSDTECPGTAQSLVPSSESVTLTCITTTSQELNGSGATEEQSVTYATTAPAVEHASCTSMPSNCGTGVTGNGLRTAGPSVSLLNAVSLSCAPSSTVASSTAAVSVEHNARTCVPVCGDRTRTTASLPDPVTSAAVAASSCSTSSVAGNTSTSVPSCGAGTGSGDPRTSGNGSASAEARATGNAALVDSERKRGTKRMCLWEDCTCVRWSWEGLLYHAVYDHMPNVEIFPCVCLWRGCGSKARRMRPSLIRHLQTHHCSDAPVPNPPCIPVTLAKLKTMSPFEYEVETPLTKAIRLTAALVLRNLVRTTPLARRKLRKFEHVLCQVALSSSEASTTVAQCLHYLYTSSDS